MPAERDGSTPGPPRPGPGQLAGVRRVRPGPVLWVDCGDLAVPPGREVVVESAQGEWTALVVVGRDQIIEAPDDLRLAGCVIRVLDEEGFREALSDASASAGEVIQGFFPDL